MDRNSVQMAKSPKNNGFSNRTRHDRNRKNIKFDRLTIGLLAAFAVVGVITAIVAFNIIRDLVGSWSLTAGLPGAPEASAGDVPTPSGTEAVVALQPVGAPTAQPWDGKSRVTMLIMGLDYEDTAERRVPRTDSMLLLTLDPISNTAGMLSIPRDAWVNIPGFDYGKINTAYFLGESYQLPGGGAGLAVQTTEAFIGVPINYYAQIDFEAFEKFIDLIGGLDIYIREEITVDPMGPGNTVTLYPGVQNLDGATVLAFARNRYTGLGDYDRAERQQQVVMAVRDQILTFNMLPTLITKAPQMYQELSAGIHTNLNLQQIVELAVLAMNVPEKNIRKGVLDQNCFTPSMYDGQSIEIPIQDQIRLKRDEIFANGEAAGPVALATNGSSADLIGLATAEAARISIQNGTSDPGLAQRTAEYLRGQGLNIVEETNADQIYYSSSILIQNGKPYTAGYMAQLMGVQSSNIYNRYQPDSYADIIVILGEDWASSNPLP
jgi:LCP family protein required for cell wall assembly